MLQPPVEAFFLLKGMEKMSHEDLMRAAIKLSETNVLESIGGPFGAVIAKDGIIIAQSANKVTTSNDPTAHAEVSAIRLACTALKTFDLSGCVIYTSCEPCPMCLGAIYWARINKIYYGNNKTDAAAIGFDDKFIYDELEKPMEERQLPIVQLLRDESAQAFKLWDQIVFKQVDTEVLPEIIQTHHLKTKSFYEILSKFFTGKINQHEQIKDIIVNAMADKFITSGSFVRFNISI